MSQAAVAAAGQPGTTAHRRLEMVRRTIPQETGVPRAAGPGAVVALPADGTPRSQRGWMLPTMTLGVIALGTATATAWRKKEAILEKAMPLGLAAVGWVMRNRMGAGGRQEEASRQRQLEAILHTSEVATHDEMARICADLRAHFPLDKQLQSLRSKDPPLSKEEKSSLWFQFEVSVLGQIVVGVYCLCFTHFVSRAVYALEPPQSTRAESVHEVDGPHTDLLSKLDIPLLNRVASGSCSQELRKAGVADLRSSMSAAKMVAIIRSIRAAVDSAIGLSGGDAADVPLHEVVLGEESRPLQPSEGGGESKVQSQLRDLLSASESRSLLSSALDQFFAVVHQHCNSAHAAIAPGSNASVIEVPVGKFFMKLSPELQRIGERNNEFLLCLKRDDVDSVWDSFFLDLFQLQTEDSTAKR